MSKPKTQPTKETAFDLSDAERVAQRDLTDAEQLRADLITQFAAGNDVSEPLNTVDEEIAATKRQLTRFTEARAAAALAGTASAKQARHEQTLSQLTDAVVGAEQLTELAKDVLLTIAELQGRLTALDDQRAVVAAALRDASREARHGAPTERAASEIHEQLHLAVNALTLPSEFIAALWDSGVGRRGIVVSEDFVQVRRPMYGNPSDPTAAASDALANVRSLAERVAEWSANANDVEAA